MVYKRITRFVADDKVVYHGGRRATQLASDNSFRPTAEHNAVWSIWAGDCGELSCAHFNREWQFHAKSHELIGAFWLVFLTEHEVLHFLNVVIARMLGADGLPLPGSQTIVPMLRILFSRLSTFPSFQPLSGNSLDSVVHHTPLTDIFLIRIASVCEIFMILLKFYWYLGFDSVPR